MGLFMRSYSFSFVFCICFVNGGPLSLEERLDMEPPFSKNIPLSVQSLLDKFMGSVDAINNKISSDISFHSLENLNGGYDLSMSDLPEHDVTGMDLIMTSSTHNSCLFVWMGNDIKLSGRRINGYVFFDIDHLLAMRHSSKLSKIRISPSLGCLEQNEPTYTFLVIYRNITKDNVYKELENTGISRFKRETKQMDPKNDECHIVPWTVEFARLKWDKYIFYPLSYEANACEGKGVQFRNCENTINKPIHMLKNYEVMQRLYTDILGVSLPDHHCCGPSKYGSQGIVLRNQSGDLVFRVVSDMRVLECSSN